MGERHPWRFFERLRGRAASSAPTQVVELGLAWAGSSVNCVPYRHNFIVKTRSHRVVGYYSEDGNVTLQCLDSEYRVIAVSSIKTEKFPYDAHMSVSLGMAASGKVHVVFGAHSSEATHVRIDPLLEGRPEQITWTDPLSTKLTYPMLFSAAGESDLILLCREGGPWNGELRVRRWDERSSTFVLDNGAIISGTKCEPRSGPYINTPVRLLTNKVALFLVWRLAVDATSVGNVTNIGLDLVIFDADLRHASTFNGVTLSLPVTPVHAPRIIPVPAGANLINQGAAALGSDGAPMAVSYWNDNDDVPQYRLVWHTVSGWREATVSQFKTRFSLAGLGTLPLPHSRPELVVCKEGLALVIFRSTELQNRLAITIVQPPYDYHRRRKTIIVVDEDLGFYEPVVDHAAFDSTGDLVMYVQWCTQEKGDGQTKKSSAIARLMRWPKIQLARWAD